MLAQAGILGLEAPSLSLVKPTLHAANSKG